jgi:hypothetical protein
MTGPELRTSARAAGASRAEASPIRKHSMRLYRFLSMQNHGHCASRREQPVERTEPAKATERTAALASIVANLWHTSRWMDLGTYGDGRVGASIL